MVIIVKKREVEKLHHHIRISQQVGETMRPTIPLAVSGRRKRGRKNRPLFHIFVGAIFYSSEEMFRLVHASNPFGSTLSCLNENVLSARNFISRMNHSRSPLSKTTTCSTTVEKKKTGFYYGISDEFLNYWPPSPGTVKKENGNSTSKNKKIKKFNSVSVQDILSDTLSEFRSTSEELRETLEAIREEMAELSRIQKQMLRQNQSGDSLGMPADGTDGDEDMGHKLSLAAQQRKKKRRKHFDKLSEEVESWAANLLFGEGSEEDGWKEIECSKLLGKRFNPEGKIKCYLKWMEDPRGEYAKSDDDGREYPCIRCYTTIDAPLEHVCAYLSDESHMKEYNELVVKHKDLEEITPYSKICWGQCPQILFIKPRDFVTFCHHRWKKDGTQVIVNQAVEHEDAPAILEEGKGKACRAYALRGANYLSRDPYDPSKTRLAILAHGDTGGNLPSWAMKAAINAVVPIEPFKLFYNIENGIQRTRLEAKTEYTSSTNGRSSRPGGLSQLGYACFWPNGGGLKECDDSHSCSDGLELGERNEEHE